MIEEFTKQWIEQVLSFWRKLDGIGLNDYDDSTLGISRFIDRNKGCCFVYIENNIVQGTILCGHDGRRGTIYHLAVEPSLRHKGIGRKLVDKVSIALLQEGIHKVNLVVFKNNDIGNHFWESIGFTQRNDLLYRDKVLG